MRRVKIFTERQSHCLEKQINYFLREETYIVYDIKYGITGNNGSYRYSALIDYNDGIVEEDYEDYEDYEEEE